jgi:hypothetical protein
MTTKLKGMPGAEFKALFQELIDELDDNDQVSFGGVLSFYRFKDRGPIAGPRHVDIEFNQVFTVTVDPDAT